MLEPGTGNLYHPAKRQSRSPDSVLDRLKSFDYVSRHDGFLVVNRCDPGQRKFTTNLDHLRLEEAYFHDPDE